MKHFYKFLFCFFWIMPWHSALAVGKDTHPTGPSLGDVADSMLVSVELMTQLLYSICYIIGGAMLVGCVILYKSHRDNPTQVPINRSILLGIFGLALIAVPLISQLSQSTSAFWYWH